MNFLRRERVVTSKTMNRGLRLAFGFLVLPCLAQAKGMGQFSERLDQAEAALSGAFGAGFELFTVEIKRVPSACGDGLNWRLGYRGGSGPYLARVDMVPAASTEEGCQVHPIASDDSESPPILSLRSVPRALLAFDPLRVALDYLGVGSGGSFDGLSIYWRLGFGAPEILFRYFGPDGRACTASIDSKRESVVSDTCRS
jgi:hypothetical protein